MTLFLTDDFFRFDRFRDPTPETSNPHSNLSSFPNSPPTLLSTDLCGFLQIRPLEKIPDLPNPSGVVEERPLNDALPCEDSDERFHSNETKVDRVTEDEEGIPIDENYMSQTGDIQCPMVGIGKVNEKPESEFNEGNISDEEQERELLARAEGSRKNDGRTGDDGEIPHTNDSIPSTTFVNATDSPLEVPNDTNTLNSPVTSPSMSRPSFADQASGEQSTKQSPSQSSNSRAACGATAFDSQPPNVVAVTSSPKPPVIRPKDNFLSLRSSEWYLCQVVSFVNPENFYLRFPFGDAPLWDFPSQTEDDDSIFAIYPTASCKTSPIRCLQKEIDQYCEEKEADKEYLNLEAVDAQGSSTLRVGLRLLSRQQSGVFFRSVVREINVDSVGVYLLDYGGCVNVKRIRQNFMALPEDLDKEPRMALRGRLANVRPKGGSWSLEAINWFIDQVGEVGSIKCHDIYAFT